MNLVLKGITSLDIIERFKSIDFDSYGFDLRPTSFNFTQIYVIREILEQVSTESNVTLSFDNEKDFVVKESLRQVLEVLHDRNKLKPEFVGNISLLELDKMEESFSWKYNEEEKLKDISRSESLRRIIFDHLDLEKINERGELFGFLNLFSDLRGKVEFELQVDWDSNLIESMFDYFTFDAISIELNSKVEHSYRNINYELAGKTLENLNTFVTSLDKESVKE